ncbi:MAG: c-type cytochrome [Rhizomicrobium sp.]|nr:c-type cytochrome [Rhizomicrobium sp.]
MRKLIAGAMLAACVAGAALAENAVPREMAWAYPTGAKSTFGPPPGAGPFTMPGSKLRFSKAQVSDENTAVDWFPDSHPPAPPVVAHNSGKGPTPCAACHFYSGVGAPGAADLAGLPAEYIIAQVTAFKTGERRSANTGQPSTGEMIKVAVAVSNSALRQAAAYYASLPRKQVVRVVESATVPKTTPDQYGWLNPAPGREAIGNRVVELAADLPAMFIGNDRIAVTDYVPPGAIARGAAIVMSGGGTGQACAMCHGGSLQGTSMAPPLAGRSAAYLARALWDIRSGARHDAAAGMMQAPARGLTPSQIVDVTAYLASRKP